MRKFFLNNLCRIFGHSWRYKDYSNWIKNNGDDYDFKASRNCSRCNQQEYLYSEWVIGKKNTCFDVCSVSDFF